MSRSPRDAQAPPEVLAVADAVAAVFAGAFDQLADWRSPIEQTLDTTADLRPADACRRTTRRGAACGRCTRPPPAPPEPDHRGCLTNAIQGVGQRRSSRS